MKPHIIVIGLYRPGTGFTRVLESLLYYLKESYQIHWIGIGYKGPVIDQGYRIYPNNVNGGDMYGAYQGKEMVEKLNPRAVILLNDFWMLKNYKHTLYNRGPSTRIIAYVPLDGKIDTPQSILGSEFVDDLVLYNHFSLNQTHNAFTILKSNQEIESFPALHVVNHGIELKSFYPIDKEKAKAEVFPHLQSDSIIVLNANRYTERKNITGTIESFAESVKNIDRQVYLCLHMPGIKPFQLEELKFLLEKNGIVENTIVNPLKDEGYVNDERLNILYNACDIGLNTSLGEGWGLVSFEHAATGAAQVVPAHTACGELWQNKGKVIPCIEDLKLNTNPFTMSRIDPLACGLILNSLYQDSDHLKETGRKCLNYTQSSVCTWNQVSDHFKSIVEGSGHFGPSFTLSSTSLSLL